MTIRPLEIAERPKWKRMRKALFPKCDDVMHAFEMDGHLAKGNDATVLFAIDEAGAILGFIELTIRERVEHSTEDHVAYVEAWYIEPTARG
ncbi:MAG: GNAT family N-acetyltransferase, partial [Bacteroidetes bacterium]|nr:GNAT family N-acetyltransferase [Bacteroidota bacterium]